MLNGRIVKLQMLEKIVFSQSTIDLCNPSDSVATLHSNISILDKEWFNFMPSNFFVSKYREELQEFKDALYAYYSFRDRITNEEIAESTFYCVVAELSDVLLAASSAINENKVDEQIVIGDFKELLRYSLELANRFGEEIIFTKISPGMITDFHTNKIKEMIDAKDIYTDCMYMKQDDNPWLKLLLKLHTMDEILDPKNKMKIVKEIRRMKYAVDNLGK